MYIGSDGRKSFGSVAERRARQDREREANRPTPVLHLIRSKSRWTRGHFVRSKLGRKVKPTSKKAHAYPLDVALSVSYPVHCELVEAYDRVLREIKKTFPWMEFVSHFNDHPSVSHALVVSVVERARV